MIGPPLNWAVLICEGYKAGDWHSPDGESQVWVERVDAEGRGPAGYFPADHRLHFSTNPSAAQPIIEREGISLRPLRREGHSLDGQWLAAYDHGNTGTMVQWVKREDWHKHYWEGPTMLIAAMRCYVAKKLGDVVEVPEELAC